MKKVLRCAYAAVAVMAATAVHAGSKEPACPSMKAAVAVADALEASVTADGPALMRANGCLGFVPLATVSAKDTITYLLPGGKDSLPLLVLAHASDGSVAMVASPEVRLTD